MACVNDDGELTRTARKLLNVIQEKPLTVEEIAKETNLPLFKVRSNMRNMSEIGFVNLVEDKYVIDSRSIELL